jgi:ketosteroid isomerase-like protein
MGPGRPSAAGTQALQHAYHRIFSTSKLEVAFDILEINLMSEEWAFARTTANGKKTWLHNSSSEQAANQELFVLRKVVGVWKIARYSFSSMEPMYRGSCMNAQLRTGLYRGVPLV